MDITFNNILSLAQLDKGIDPEVRIRLKALPGGAYGSSIAKLHDYLKKSNSAGLVPGLVECNMVIDDVLPVIESEEYKQFLAQPRNEQIQAIEELEERYAKAKVSEILQEAHDYVGSNVSSTDCIQQILDKLYSIPTTKKTQTLMDAAKELLSDVVTSIEQGKPLSIPSGYQGLDYLTGGFLLGTITTLMGGTGSGKTTFAMNVARNWCKAGEKVLYVNLEMPNSAMAQKLLYTETVNTNVEINRHEFKNPSYELRDKIVGMIQHLNDYDIEFFNCDDWVAIAQKIRQSDARCIVIDHLNLIASEFKDIERVSKELTSLARSTKKVFLELVQHHRQKYYSGSTTPQLSDHKGGTAIENAASNCLGFYDPNPDENKFNPTPTLELHVLKSRYGEQGKVTLEFNKPRQLFTEIKRN